MTFSQSGDWARAEASFRRLSKSEPDNPGVWANLGSLYERSGRLADARSAFAKAFALDPGNADFAARAAMVSLKMREPRTAESFARCALAKDASNGTALSALSGSLVVLGRPKEALPWLRRLDFVRRGGDEGVVRGLLTCLASSGSLADAVSECRKRLSRFPKSAGIWSLMGDLSGQLGVVRKTPALVRESRSAYAKAFSLDPGNVRAGVNGAQASEMAGDMAEARRLYALVLGKHPGNALANYGMGRATMSETGLPESAGAGSARKYFEAAHSAEPRNPDYAVALGYVLALCGPDHYAASINAYRAALRGAPADGRARRGLVDVLVKSGKFGDALAEQRQLLRDEPSDKEVHRRLSGLLRTLGKDPEAWDVLRQMATRFPKDPMPLKDLGLLLEQAGKFDEAEKALSQALSRAPKDAELAVSLGLVLEKAGRRTAAAQRFRDAIAWSPRLETANVALVNVLSFLGDEAGARKAREAWVAADPTNNRARYELAQSYLLRGEDAKALENYRALVLRKDDPERQTYLLAPAKLLVLRGRWDEALAEYRRLLEMDKSESLRLGYAEVLEKAGRPADARRELESILRTSKDPLPVRKALAGHFESQSAWDDAARIWEDMASTHANDPAFVEGLVRVRRAQGDADRAWTFLERWLLLGGVAPDAAVLRAMDAAWAADANRERVLGLTERLVQAYPKLLAAWSWRVDALLRGAPNAQAKRSAADGLGRMAELAPKDADVLLRRGRLLEELGDTAGALAAFRESAKRDPAGPAVQLLRSRGLEVPAGKPVGGGKP